MSENSTNVPKLRFPGFTKNWEQRKLGDFIEDYIEKTTIQNQYPVLTSSQQMGIVLQEEYFANRQVTTSENVGYFVLPKGYFTYRSRSDNDVFVFNRNDLIDKGIISYFYPVFRVKNADSDFFLRRLNFGIERQISIAAEGTGQHVLPLKKFKDVVAMFPSVQEQTKIGAFFRNLDNLITLHQCKLNHLQELKKGLFQKMFPKNGANVPEIRFPGFTDAWEQRKLGDVSIRVLGNDGRMDLPTLTISAGSGWLDQRERFSGNIAGKEQKNYTLLSKGELSYNHGNSKIAKYGAVFKLRTYEEALVPRVYHSFRTTEEASPDFIEYMFATKLPDKELAKLITSGARLDGLLNINYDKFMSINITLPKIKEQIQIGKFFRNLDHLITLHQRKLNHLQEQKKALLQQMFV